MTRSCLIYAGARLHMARCHAQSFFDMWDNFLRHRPGIACNARNREHHGALRLTLQGERIDRRIYDQKS